jgi:hypothetical protein
MILTIAVAYFSGDNIRTNTTVKVTYKGSNKSATVPEGAKYVDFENLSNYCSTPFIDVVNE